MVVSLIKTRLFCYSDLFELLFSIGAVNQSGNLLTFIVWSTSTLSPYFLGFSLAAIHLRASTLSLLLLVHSVFSTSIRSPAFPTIVLVSFVESSAISMIWSANSSACASRARAYLLDNSASSFIHSKKVTALMPTSLHILCSPIEVVDI
jgi:hypothetical protein